MLTLLHVMYFLLFIGLQAFMALSTCLLRQFLWTNCSSSVGVFPYSFVVDVLQIGGDIELDPYLICSVQSMS